MYNALRLYFRREFIGRPHGGSPLSGGKNYSNVTLGKYNCLYIKLSARTGNGGSPILNCTKYDKVTLGKYNCLYIKLSARTGNGGLPCGRIISAPTKLRKQLKCYARVIMFELLQTVFTNGVQRHAAGDTPSRRATASCLWKNAFCITI